MKLHPSKPQLQLLYELAKKPVHCVSYYSPAVALVKRGLASWSTTREQTLLITERGQQLINVRKER